MGNTLDRRNETNEEAKEVKTNSLKIVIISDTHGDHRAINVPDGDVLIHGGDFTCYGKIEHAHDFNEWLGTLPHRHKVVINGNHESNAPWKNQTKDILTNAHFLRQEAIIIYRNDGSPIKIYGTEFCWHDAIDSDTAILVAHSPVDGFVDGGNGCPTLKQRCMELKSSLKLVIGGHIHSAHGHCWGSKGCAGIQFVNASICGAGRCAEYEPIITFI
jgi:calcineurin-like phosphoesterase family protein